MSKLLLIHGTITELAKPNYDSATRILELETLLRESLNKTGDRAWHEKVCKALGDPFPAPIRKLKGKIPRYQEKLIKEGKLEG